MEVYEDIYTQPHYLDEVINKGGQGIVYRTKDPDVALKLELRGGSLIKGGSGNETYQNLRMLPIPKGLHITMPRAPLKDVQGYVMTLLSDMISFGSAFEDMPEPVPQNPWIDRTFAKEVQKATRENYLLYWATGGTRRRLEAYQQAAVIISRLHENGLVYCDFNPQNLFVSAQTEGDGPPSVWLIDADNLNFREEIPPGGGAYTWDYCAPEAPAGRFSLASDSYSFAVMLFEHLTMLHPFKGEQYRNGGADWAEEDVDEQLERGEFPWIWDEDEPENFAQDRIDRSLFLTEGLRCLFDRTFSRRGREEPRSRPSMAEWALELSRALDQTAVCPSCGMHFHAAQEMLCPCCGWKVSFLTVVCRAADGRGEKLWRLCRELPEGERIPVPVRAVGGFITDEDYAFWVKAEEDKLFLTQFSRQFRFAWKEGGAFSPVPGTIGVRRGTLTLRVTDRQDGFTTVIEVSAER